MFASLAARIGYHQGSTPRTKEDAVSDHTPGVPEHPASPEQPDDGFAEGEASPEVFPEDEEVRRFSEGQEELPEEDPEKHEERRFSEGQDHQPPGATP
jgi:hypothetical protein